MNKDRSRGWAVVPEGGPDELARTPLENESTKEPETRVYAPQPDTENPEEIAKAKGRKVRRCAVLSLVGGTPVVLAELAPAGKNLMAVLAVPGTSALAMVEYPAKADPSRTSCWRVDDGCHFPLDSLQILFGLSGPDGSVFAVAWGAFEGENESLVRVEGAALVEVVTGYRYWSPM